MAPRRKTRQQIDYEIRDLDESGESSPESDNAEAVESGRNRGRGRVKLPDAWTRVLKIDDRLKLP